MMDRTAKSRVRGAALAFAVALAFAAALALVWATPGVAHADDPPSVTFHVSSEAATLTNEDGEQVRITKIVTVVNVDFSAALLEAGIDPSSITVTLDGIALDFTKHVFTFNHRRLSVTIEEWRKGTVTKAELQQRRSGNVRVSYVPPASAGAERLRYASGSDVGTFAVRASVLTSSTRELADAVNFVAPAKPKTVTATTRGNASPTKSQTVKLEPVSASRASTSAPTGQDVTDIVRRICGELGGSNCS